MTASTDDRFIEAMGAIAQAEGTPRIAGQIVGYLALAGEARSLTDIASGLGVSKASVSTNVRMLEARGQAIRESRTGSREDHWRVLPPPHEGMLSAMSDRFLRHAERIEALAQAMPPGADGKRETVHGFAQFYRSASELLHDWSVSARREATAADPVPQTSGT
ncbi:MAG: transcriptional regulator [Roseivivax sp.]|nr:transcriptional regulator [Roseivivax sp.]